MNKTRHRPERLQFESDTPMTSKGRGTRSVSSTGPGSQVPAPLSIRISNVTTSPGSTIPGLAVLLKFTEPESPELQCRSMRTSEAPARVS